MQNNRFVVLTGHLSNYRLSDLIGILRQQRKSGRLLIEYTKGPASLFFENGELIDVRLNELSGLQAICVLLAQPEASFNFNPLIKSSQRTIESSLQRVVSELFGCWDESPLQINSSTVRPPTILEEDVRPVSIGALEPIPRERLALPPANALRFPPRSLLMMGAAVLIIIGISTVIAVTDRFRNAEPRTLAASEQVGIATKVQSQTSNQSKPTVAKNRSADAIRNSRGLSRYRDNKSSSLGTRESSDEPKTETKQTAAEVSRYTESSDHGSASESIKVVMQIENGRVLKASIANHAPGMGNFEALALRIARQRRYPSSKNGAETVTVSVDKPK